MSTKDAATLRDRDPAIEAIRERGKSGKRISFPWLRATIGRDRSVWSQLGRGTAVLTSTEQLDQYLYSYGPMIACQWETLLSGASPVKGSVRLVDYGCGQGLAGLLLFDIFGDAFSSALTKVVLVEPSQVALLRAEAVYRCIAPSSEITCVNKGFDKICAADLVPDNELRTIHIFSNVLDVTGFDQYRLFGEILTPGKHTILAVSHNRDFDGGTERIRGIKEAIEDPEHGDELTVKESAITEFLCGQGDKYSAVSWIAKLKVPHG